MREETHSLIVHVGIRVGEHLDVSLHLVCAKTIADDVGTFRLPSAEWERLDPISIRSTALDDLRLEQRERSGLCGVTVRFEEYFGVHCWPTEQCFSLDPI